MGISAFSRRRYPVIRGQIKGLLDALAALAASRASHQEVTDFAKKFAVQTAPIPIPSGGPGPGVLLLQKHLSRGEKLPRAPRSACAGVLSCAEVLAARLPRG